MCRVPLVRIRWDTKQPPPLAFFCTRFFQHSRRAVPDLQLPRI